MAFVTETVETAPVPTVVEVGAHVYVVSGATCICALQGFGSFVLMPIGNSLTWASLRVSVKLAYWHDRAYVLEKRGQSLLLRNEEEQGKDTLTHN